MRRIYIEINTNFNILPFYIPLFRYRMHQKMTLSPVPSTFDLPLASIFSLKRHLPISLFGYRLKILSSSSLHSYLAKIIVHGVAHPHLESLWIVILPFIAYRDFYSCYPPMAFCYYQTSCYSFRRGRGFLRYSQPNASVPFFLFRPKNLYNPP